MLTLTHKERDKLFYKPSPEGWVPKVGDWVYLRASYGLPLASQTECAKVFAVGGSIALVRAKVGSRVAKAYVDVCNLRPDNRTKVKRDEFGFKGMNP